MPALSFAQDGWRYDIDCGGAGVSGTYLVKIHLYGKKSSVPADEFKKNAVHGVLFKGFSGNAVAGCTAQRAIIANPATYDDKQDFFKMFFATKGGDYLKYASLISGTPEVMKIGKEYKVSMVVSVAKDMLRSDLEKAGIIKGLGSGF
ncbi:hypothetical protein AGMMS49574_29810 [Bacteroidia bacterium]|nr:hypothetical protein AGMMS49574_29810 [Bacteroidia bacterium]